MRPQTRPTCRNVAVPHHPRPRARSRSRFLSCPFGLSVINRRMHSTSTARETKAWNEAAVWSSSRSPSNKTLSCASQADRDAQALTNVCSQVPGLVGTAH
jgi:hypothetical protein